MTRNLHTALITGASSGIGEAFAGALAARGHDLILVARSEDKLRTLAKQLAEVHSRRVEVIAADLTHAGAADKVFAGAEALGMPVDLLVNNAGFGSVGSFEKLEGRRERDEVLLNCAAVVDMCHAFVPGMIARGKGGVINIASMAAFQPLPYMSVYAATKAFVLSFSRGLRGEVKSRGIDVLAVCPGPVDTPFFEATGNVRLRSTVPKATMMTVDAVVRASLKAYDAGRSVVVPGAANKLVAASAQMMPHDALTAVTAKFMRR
ncbi:MAG TPA: SDR family oxidoreductase [Verrucomicrobiae bacterium]|nr:SDR family oxidoreductase [Verrucomicrobiae bacterium]